MNREIKFRVWDNQRKDWISPNDCSLHCQSNWMLDVFTGKVIDVIASTDGHYSFNEYDQNHYFNGTKVVKKPRMVIQQYTGLKDKNDKEVYDGDILKIKYFVGDFAWESMTEEEADIQEKMQGQEYIVQVQKDLIDGANMILCGTIDVGLIYFPLHYISSGEVLGNIHENPELIKIKL